MADFGRVPDGYDPDQVDRRLAALTRELSATTARLHLAESQAEALRARQRELSESQGAGRSPGSVHDLGARVEQLLRLAEQQGADVLAAVEKDAQELIGQAEQEAARIAARADRGISPQVWEQLKEEARAEVRTEGHHGGVGGSGDVRRRWFKRR